MPKRKHILFLTLNIACITYYFCLPKPLFNAPLSQVLESSTGELLAARIATDGQWRFPSSDSIPEKFEQAIIQFEDRRFKQHWGVDLRAILRASMQNIRAGSIQSGASTLSMQSIRMARQARKRNLWNKFIELILATRLELRYSKADILNLYASNAPFGGNVVGLDAAAWRYFAKSPELLSWSEAASLAVLPNSPALIHPGRNRAALLAKRNRLLDRLLEVGALDSLTCSLAKAESLPEKPHPLPRLAPHLLDRAMQEQGSFRLKTTLNANLQQRVNRILERHHAILQQNYVHNAAALILDIETGNVLAYVGNVPTAAQGAQVDVIRAPRSTGSILKPLLYAAMLQDGRIIPSSLIPDIPTQIRGYRPENFHDDYDGVVSAERALARSLNIPLVRMLQQHGLEKFHFQLRQLHFSTITQPPEHYGLTLILGGAETTLEQITNTYACMARTLHHFVPQSGHYQPQDFRAMNYLAKPEQSNSKTLQKDAPYFDAAAIYQTFQAMETLERPNSEGEWASFASSRRIAWKTGTSFGSRDAWAVGLDTRYAVGVWVGNADGEGRPKLVGVQAAAPILFDIFKELPATNDWFDTPYDEMRQLSVCRTSGYRPLDACPIDTLWVHQNALNLVACPYHKRLHLDESRTWRVHSNCEVPYRIQQATAFVLPPIEAAYYKAKMPSYQSLPPFRADCILEAKKEAMQLIYPKPYATISLPIDLSGERSSSVFRAAHREASTAVYWHLDDVYLGTTQHFHELELQPELGWHRLTLVDEQGARLDLVFEVVE